MNYGISILFRAIPLLMALFCFGYGAFVLHEGVDSAKFVAGPVVFSLGMICITLYNPQNHPSTFSKRSVSILRFFSKTKRLF